MSLPRLLVVAHGSRDPRHAATVHALVGRVRALRPGVRVETGFLDFNAPSVPQVLERLAADEPGARGAAVEVVALPLLLTRAFHAKSDIPAVLAEASARLPRLRVRQAEVLGPVVSCPVEQGAAPGGVGSKAEEGVMAEPSRPTTTPEAAVPGTATPRDNSPQALGPSPLLLAALERRLTEAGAAPSAAVRRSTGVVLASAGSTDPEAIAAIAETARELRRTGWCSVRPAFASASLPRTEDAVRALRADGCARVAVAPYVIAPGRLPDRIAAGAREADVLADVLGPSPELARLLVERYEQAVAAARGERAAPARIEVSA
ncbi:sirohydrochlorin chelatase [Streptomyces sp. NPDC048057]|uniref:sirohydrochlorin chelatase n=1 Tax=Streptomyces sp. NPDC048057 TaxID=3155628 RepID=UPI0033C81903